MNSENITGLQHVGIPTNDMEKTLEFYHALGFKTAFETVNETPKGKERVVFLKCKNLVVEAYENHQAVGKAGAIDHIALDVLDIEEAFSWVKTLGYEMLDSEINYLPFWEAGVRFFTILGPNQEKVEFSQMLKKTQ